MGSFIEINDTLQITTEQGFPHELDLETHLQTPYNADDFANKVFEFKNKPKVRLYHLPPVRVFFAHNLDGRWLYWGQVEILKVTLDYANQTTSGKYRITHIFTPDEMRQAEFILHTDAFADSRYFANANNND